MRLFPLIITILHTSTLIGQASSESPYSAQNYDATANMPWYSSPLTVGAVILVAAVIFLLVRSRRR